MRFFSLLLIQLILSNDIVFSQGGMWAWIKGDTTGDCSGVYGVQGIPDPDNSPPCLYECCEWTDKQGNFWLQGGYKMSDIETHTALWKFDVTSNEWIWMKGPSSPNQAGIYGTQNIPDPLNYPGSRSFGVASWTDTSGNLWLFGGLGYDETGLNGYMNDLWKYNITTNEWTWIRGSPFAYSGGNYGTQGIPDPSNDPPARYEVGCAWTDDLNNLWFFGGGNFGGDNYNDLWKYDISTNQWAWMHGSDAVGASAIYGTQGVPDPLNTPGARWVHARWKDLLGNFWLMGGHKTSNNYNDLWKYDVSTNMWTWMNGSTSNNPAGNFGTKCQPSLSNTPSGRYENRSTWTDCLGNFYFFGGVKFTGTQILYGDLWFYSPDSNEWAWIGGDTVPNSSPIYGSQGIPSPNNKPDARRGAVGWSDPEGNLWLFGGGDATANVLWKFVQDSNCMVNANCNFQPSAAFSTGDTTLCEKFCIGFTDQSTNNPDGWQWQFPGGSPSSSTDQHPQSICYNTPGIYDVILIASNAYGSDTIVLPDYITVYPTPGFPVITQNGDTLTSSPASFYQWQFNSADIPGATNQSYAATQSGYYTVIITDDNGCVNSTTVYIVITGIGSVADNSNISIYPNPNHGTFTIELLNDINHGALRITVTNTIGQEVFSIEEKMSFSNWKKEIHLINPANGIYFVEIKMKDNLVKDKIMIAK